MYDRDTLLDLQGNNLVTIAVLKSVQINQTINSLYNQAYGLTTRVLIQAALVKYYAEHESPNSTFPTAYSDLSTAIGTQQLILGGRIYANDFTPLPNFTLTNVPYNFSNSLFPTSIPPPPRSGNQINAGLLLGPEAVPDTPGSYILSLTIPIVNTNASSNPLILGYIAMVMTATGLLRAVNDSTGIGSTGQLLAITRNGSHYDVVLPPFRTPQLYGQDFYHGQYPAVDMAFKNRTSYLISTHNVANESVSVGYTVLPFRATRLLTLAPLYTIRTMGNPR